LNYFNLPIKEKSDTDEKASRKKEETSSEFSYIHDLHAETAILAKGFRLADVPPDG